jgi:hypothetical protein
MKLSAFCSAQYLSRLNLHDDKADDVHPDRSICQPTDVVQTADTSAKSPYNGEDEDTDDETDPATRQLANELTRSQSEHGYSHELLERLHDVDEVARFSSIHTEEGVSITDQRKASRVESQKDSPQDPSTESCAYTK